MSEETSPSLPMWRQILRLGEQLITQTDPAAQRDLLEAETARLLQGEATFWTADSIPPDGPAHHAAMSGQVMPQFPTSSPALACPLATGETEVGVLEVRRPEGPPFEVGDRTLLKCIATQATITLKAARQVATERWRVEQLSLVRAVSAQVADVMDLDELCRRVAELILNTFDYYYVALFTLEPGEDALLCRANAGPPGTPVDSRATSLAQIPLGTGLIGHAARDGQQIAATDVRQEPRYRHHETLPETRSEIALPLQIEERVLGVLDVQSDQPDAFDETDLLVLGALADQIAIAVEDARLYTRLQRRADQLATIAKVSRAVASILDLDTLLIQVIELIQEVTDYPHIRLFTVDPLSEQVIYRAGTGGEIEEESCTLPLDIRAGVVPRVACQGELLVSNDLESDPRIQAMELTRSGTRSELAIPLTFGRETLGVLDIQSDQPNAFDEDDLVLFEGLADTTASAIRNANLYRSEQARRQVADSLQDVAGLLSDGVALNQVLEAILTALGRNLPCDAAAIWLLNEETLRLAAARDYTHLTDKEGLSGLDDLSAEAAPWLYQMMRAKHPIIRTSYSPAEPLGAALDFGAEYSAILAPMHAGDDLLGLLILAHESPGRYGGESQAMTAAFASHAAVAIQNTQLYQESQERALISTVMLRVAKATQSLTTLDDVLHTVAELTPMLIGVDRCALMLKDQSSDAFLPSASYGLTADQEELFEEWRVSPKEEPAFANLTENKKPVYVPDVTSDLRLSGADVWTLGFDSLLMLPLIARSDVVGAMLVDYRSEWIEEGVLTANLDEHLAIVQGVAYQTATAVENARLREAQQEEAYVSTALLQVAQIVASMNDLDDILSTIIRIMPLLIGVKNCAIFLWDAEQKVFEPIQTHGFAPRPAAQEADRPPLKERRYATGEFPLLDAVRERDDVVIYNAEALEGQSEAVSPTFAADFLAPSRAHPLLALPLSVQGVVLGAFLLEDIDAPHRSQERRLEIITGIAQQAALAVQNDRFQREMTERERLERELQLAHQIQETFMPRQRPEAKGWDIAFSWRAARQVAGDFYDFFSLPGDSLGLVIADVADKGMPAALFMAITRTLMRAAALERNHPSEALARVNDLLAPDAEQGMFVTAFYGILSLESGRLTYANAGHTPPLYLEAKTKTFQRLTRTGMALGVMKGTYFDERTIALAEDDLLVLYTDGITETFSPSGDMFDIERLQATILTAEDQTAQALLDSIDQAVTDFSQNASPSDDRTQLIVRRQRALA